MPWSILLTSCICLTDRLYPQKPATKTPGTSNSASVSITIETFGKKKRVAFMSIPELGSEISWW